MFDQLRYIGTRFRRFQSQFSHVPRVIELVWSAARGWTTAWAALLVVQGVLPAATVYVTRALVNSIVAAHDSGGTWLTVRQALELVAVMTVLLLLTQVLSSLTNWVRGAQADLVRDHVAVLIQDKSVAVDMAFYEWPEFYNRLEHARMESSYRPLALLDSFGGALQNGITLLAMGAALASFGVWLPLILFASTIPALFIVLAHAAREHQWRVRIASDERRAQYYDAMLASGQVAAEVRLFSLGDHFKAAFLALRRTIRGERLQLLRDETLGSLGAGALTLLMTGATMLWMVWRTVQGRLTLGDLAFFYQAFNQGQRLMRSLLDNVGQIYANSLFLGNLFEFLALKSEVVDRIPPHDFVPPRPSTSGGAVIERAIRFEHVTFRYPGSQRLALDDFSLAIPEGQVVAIVGTNGAGKSTLIKLLCRFYDPHEGRITLDGTDLRDWPIASLRQRITAIFQEPVRYHDTAGGNIAIGDLSARPDSAMIVAAARAAWADQLIGRLPQGYDTQLGKWFAHGHELSTGEWQRIGLARALVRPAPIMLLDEPTSAMDSWAEADWLQQFRVVSSGRTVMVITHRFTTAMRADVIHVVADGRIVESGHHEELVARGGRYAHSWKVQTMMNAPPRVMSK